jgi:hypothetical protein
VNDQRKEYKEHQIEEFGFGCHKDLPAATVRCVQVVHLRFVFAQAPCQMRVLTDDQTRCFYSCNVVSLAGLGFFPAICESRKFPKLPKDF